MNDIIIHTSELSKVYRLYSKPHLRFLDMFGLLRRSRGAYTEHAALDGISITIRRGEKVAIIGRNGAGKSTLLKILCRVIQPTSGSVEIGGKVHALLQIGSGFHPDFTGRENVFSYLAQLGITAQDAQKKFDEILEFSELHEYIDQPVKTYSTGMGVRLMFSTSTAVTPDILVLDEVLGVGDAYFAQKSFQRIMGLCEGAGTTLLLVTHDLYAAMNVCERVIWIEKGSVLMDADAKTVIHRYEASIRDQQEARLRTMRLQNLQRNLDAQQHINGRRLWFGQIRCSGNVPIDNPLPIFALKVWHNEQMIADIMPGETEHGNNIQLLINNNDGNWTAKRTVADRTARDFAPHGSIYHRAPFVLEAEPDLMQNPDSLFVEMEFLDTAQTPCLVEFFADGNLRLRAFVENTGSGAILSKRLALQPTRQLEADLPAFNRYGSQVFSITNVSFHNATGDESHSFKVGEKISIRLDYVIRDPAFRQKPIINLNFMKSGVTRSHRFTLEGILFDGALQPRGSLEILADPLLIGPGEYLINIAVMREGGYDNRVFFTANENLLDHHSRAYQIVIEPTTHVFGNDVVFYHPVTWLKDGQQVYAGCHPLTP